MSGACLDSRRKKTRKTRKVVHYEIKKKITRGGTRARVAREFENQSVETSAEIAYLENVQRPQLPQKMQPVAWPDSSAPYLKRKRQEVALLNEAVFNLLRKSYEKGVA